MGGSSPYGVLRYFSFSEADITDLKVGLRQSSYLESNHSSWYVSHWEREKSRDLLKQSSAPPALTQPVLSLGYV